MAERPKVVCYTPHNGTSPGHEDVTRACIAKDIASLLGLEAAPYNAVAGGKAPQLYFVPACTLIHEQAEAEFGITSETHLFGGVVPHAHVATKIVTHPLVDAHAAAPAAWSHAFGRRSAGVVLPGYAAFTHADAKRAAAALMERGRLRVKRACATGGRGQSVVSTMDEAHATLAAIDPIELERDGVVLELDLDPVETLSVGQVRLGPWLASYHGVQHLATDHGGNSVYGGSSLVVVRGGFDALLAEPLARNIRTAVEQARRYDCAASEAFAPFYASRRNYDIAQGMDSRGCWHSGVLEQSWRLGGASGAELAALSAFSADPGLRTVRAGSTEVYGPCAVPHGARVHFSGDDARVGRLTKYVTVEPG